MNEKLNGQIIWFTGLSGSGKSTLAKTLKKLLIKNGLKTIIVDGDIFRRKKKYKSKFSKSAIINNNIQIVNYLKKIRNKYNCILVSVISPLLETRLKAKKIFKNNYIEILVKCSISELIKRDTKGLYKLAKANKLKNLIGYKSKVKYENSNYPKIVVNTQNKNKNECIHKIKFELKKKFNVKI